MNMARRLSCFLPGCRTSVVQQRVQGVSASPGAGLSDGAQGWEGGRKQRKRRKEGASFPLPLALGC